jgi:DNA-binding transcriptional LysR family regulator
MSFDLDELSDLALFARVVEQRSFTGAAEQSNIAKSAVSRRISALEARLGVQLLRRTTRSVSVTAEGARFYEHCARLFEVARSAKDAIAGTEKVMRGTLRISAPITLSQMFLARAITSFLQEYPEIDAQLIVEDQMVDITNGGFDLVIRVARLNDASFVARKLAADRLVVVGSREYLTKKGRPQRPEELVGHNCMHYGLIPYQAEWRFRSAENSFVPPQGNFTVTNGGVLKEAVCSGLGLAVLPFFMVAKEVATGELEVVLSKHRRAEIGVFAVVSSMKGLPLRTRALIDFLVRWFSRSNWRET